MGCRTECREVDFTGYIGYAIELGKATEAFPLKTERGIIGVLRCTGILIRSTVVVVNYTVTVEVYYIVVSRLLHVISGCPITTTYHIVPGSQVSMVDI